MKRHSWLTTAIASLLGTAACAALGLAADNLGAVGHTGPSHRYSIGDAGVQKASATSYTNNHADKTANADLATQSHDAYDSCDACDACDPCGCGCGWFVEVEGLAWWRKSRNLPPLVTTNTAFVLPAQAGVIGEPTTRVLFGGESIEDGISPGGRINFGRWFGGGQDIGVGANFFILDQEDINFAQSATGVNDILAMPFFDPSIPGEASRLLNYPGITSNGRASIAYQNDVMGADAYLRKLVYADDEFRVEFIGGYQFSRIDDGISINGVADQQVNLINSNFNITDNFNATNEFHGGSVGVLAQVDRGCWRIKGLAKCGLGNMHQTVDVSGQTIVTPLAGGGAPAVSNFGLYALPTNIGTYQNDEFGIIPEARINVGYRLTDNWTFGVGYSFIYWNDIMTAGAAIDRNINQTQIPPSPAVPPAVPGPPNFFNTSDFFVQGLNFSAEFAY